MTTYEKRRQQGLCSRCGKNPVTEHTMCEDCRLVHKGYYREGKKSKKYRQKRKKALQVWRDENREYANKRDRVYIAELKREVFSHYGNVCACCGETEEVFLTLDHKWNDGKEDRRAAGKTNFYRYVRQQGYPDTVQLMCWNCNLAKRINGFCPHHPKLGRHHVWFADHCANCNSSKTVQTTQTMCQALEEFSFRGERQNSRGAC